MLIAGEKLVQGGVMDAEPAPFSLPSTQSLILPGPVAGEGYRIDIALPSGACPPGGWPAVVLLDAAGCFATCVEAMRRMSRRQDATGVGQAVLIGISPADGDPANARRQRDFTSTRTGGKADAGADAGGAEAFLAFIERQVLPTVSARLPLAEGRLTLFGHSLAGYFALWVLANRPRLFRSYAAISPSIWWDREGLFDAFSRAQIADRRLFMAVGEWEEALPPWQLGLPGSEEALARRKARRMIANVLELGAALQAAMGEERASFRLLPEEDHASIVSAAIPRMLRMASLL